MKALIDAGTCSSITTTSNCGDDATGYYETFEYNGSRVIIVSGAPNHEAESELFISTGYFNPNTRCELKTKNYGKINNFAMNLFKYLIKLFMY